MAQFSVYTTAILSSRQRERDEGIFSPTVEWSSLSPKSPEGQGPLQLQGWEYFSRKNIDTSFLELLCYTVRVFHLATGETANQDRLRHFSTLDIACEGRPLIKMTRVTFKATAIKRAAKLPYRG